MAYIPPGTWEAIRREWRLGRDSNRAVARRHNLHFSSILGQAARKEWGERGAEHDNTLLTAEVALDDVLFEMSKKLAMIRDPEALASLQSADEDARILFSVTRDIRRAIVEVKKAQVEAGAERGASGPSITALDFDAAKKEVLARFDNLAAWLANDRAEHPES